MPTEGRTFILTGDRRKAGALVLAGWQLRGTWERATVGEPHGHPVGFCLEYTPSPAPIGPDETLV